MEDMMQALHQMKHKLYDLADAVSEVMAELSDIEKEKLKKEIKIKSPSKESVRMLKECGFFEGFIKGLEEPNVPSVFFKDVKENFNNCNCKHKGECYKTLGDHGYNVTNCKGLVE